MRLINQIEHKWRSRDTTKLWKWGIITHKLLIYGIDSIVKTGPRLQSRDTNMCIASFLWSVIDSPHVTTLSWGTWLSVRVWLQNEPLLVRALNQPQNPKWGGIERGWSSMKRALMMDARWGCLSRYANSTRRHRSSPSDELDIKANNETTNFLFAQ